MEQGTPSAGQPSAVGCGSEKEEGRWRYVREKSSLLPGCGGWRPRRLELLCDEEVGASQLSAKGCTPLGGCPFS